MASKQADSDNEQEDDVQSYQYKIILLGDGAVGKTSIATRFSEEKFSQNYKQTVGVDFFMKRINIPRKQLVFAKVPPHTTNLTLICMIRFFSQSPNSLPNMGHWWTGNVFVWRMI